MKKLTESQRIKLWDRNVNEAKEILAKNKLNQMEVARLALDVCEISWGGSHHRSRFTLTEFAKETGVLPKTLSNWVAIRVSVYDKLPPAYQARAKFKSMQTTAAKVFRDTPSEKVLSVFREITEGSSFDQTMGHYLCTFKSVTHNLVINSAAKEMSPKILEEFLFYCGKISYQIRKDRPELKPADHKVASTSGKSVIGAAAALLGRAEREKGRDMIRCESGLIIKVTPKDRDVIGYLRKQGGRWVSPTEIGMKAHGLNSSSASAWAYRTLNKFTGTKLVERNKKGHYRWSGAPEKEEAK